jgi:hypothetical protein
MNVDFAMSEDRPFLPTPFGILSLVAARGPIRQGLQIHKRTIGAEPVTPINCLIEFSAVPFRQHAGSSDCLRINLRHLDEERLDARLSAIYGRKLCGHLTRNLFRHLSW